MLLIKLWRQSAFAKTPLTARHRIEAHRRQASMPVMCNWHISYKTIFLVLNLLRTIVFPALVGWQFWSILGLIFVTASTEIIVANSTAVSRTWLLCNVCLPLHIKLCPLSVYPCPLLYNCFYRDLPVWCFIEKCLPCACQTSIVSVLVETPPQLQSFIAHSELTKIQWILYHWDWVLIRHYCMSL